MRITCDECGQKYQITDEKMRGRAFKGSCKNCGAPMIVVVPSAPFEANHDSKPYDLAGSPRTRAAAAMDSRNEDWVHQLVEEFTAEESRKRNALGSDTGLRAFSGAHAHGRESALEEFAEALMTAETTPWPPKNGDQFRHGRPQMRPGNGSETRSISARSTTAIPVESASTPASWTEPRRVGSPSVKSSQGRGHPSAEPPRPARGEQSRTIVAAGITVALLGGAAIWFALSSATDNRPAAGSVVTDVRTPIRSRPARSELPAPTPSTAVDTARSPHTPTPSPEMEPAPYEPPRAVERSREKPSTEATKLSQPSRTRSRDAKPSQPAQKRDAKASPSVKSREAKTSQLARAREAKAPEKTSSGPAPRETVVEPAQPPPTPRVAMVAPPAAPPVEPVLSKEKEAPARPPFDGASVDAAISKERKTFEACVAAAALANPKLAAEGLVVTLTMTIAPTGKVLEPSIEEPGVNRTEMGACLRKASERIEVPAFAGEPVRVRKPFTLHRPKGGAPGKSGLASTRPSSSGSTRARSRVNSDHW